MELSILGKDLLGEYEAKTLFVLNRATNSMSGRQISRTIGAPNSTIQRILARFEKSGIVQTDPHPGIVLYTLNKDHILYNTLTAIFQIRKDFNEKMIEIFEPIIAEDSSLVLYGPTAKYESRLEDNVDLYIVHPDYDDNDDNDDYLDKVSAASRELQKCVGNHINLTHIDQTTFRNLVKIKDSTILKVLQEGKKVIGRSLQEWAQEFGWKPEEEKPQPKTGPNKIVKG